MSEQVAAYEVLPGPGTRVRERRAPVTRGPRVGTVEKSIGTPPGCVAVRWDGDPSGAQPWCMRLDTLLPERDTPKYAPERELAPGIVVQDDTCDGSPRIAGTRLGTDAIAFYWRREVVEGHKPAAAYRRVAETYGTSIYDVHNAVLFDAGVRAEKERRRAKRQRRAKGTRNEPETGQGDTGAGETRTDTDTLRLARAALAVLPIVKEYEDTRSEEWPCLGHALWLLESAESGAVSRREPHD